MGQPVRAASHCPTAAMRATYRTAADRLDALRSSFNPAALSLFDDHVDSAQVTAARADQVDALYAYAASWQDGTCGEKRAVERRAVAHGAVAHGAVGAWCVRMAWDDRDHACPYRAAAARPRRYALSSHPCPTLATQLNRWLHRDLSADIDVAETYIRHHEERYRTPLERIAGWRYNPTVPCFLMRPPDASPNPGRTLTHPSLVFTSFRRTGTRTCGRPRRSTTFGATLTRPR